MDQSAARLASRPSRPSRQETDHAADTARADAARLPVTARDRLVIAVLWAAALLVMGAWGMAIVAALRWLG